MTDTMIVAIIAAIPGTVAAFAAWDARRRTSDAAERIGETKALVSEIEISINSRMTALLEQTADAARLAGIAAERTRHEALDARDSSMID